MFCPGISQNSKLHHLTLYKGQVWTVKSYLELCNHNVLNVVYGPYANFKLPVEKNGKLHVPPVPGLGFIRDNTMIPWDSEILRSFAEITDIINITFLFLDEYGDSALGVTYQVAVGSFKCQHKGKDNLCLPPNSHAPYYIWTKEGFQIKINQLNLQL